jgi:hypothetical protein
LILKEVSLPDIFLELEIVLFSLLLWILIDFSLSWVLNSSRCWSWERD